EYKEKVFPKNIRRRLAVEAGSPIGWCKYVTDDGDVIGITKFGESAPGEEVMKEYGFTSENVVARAKALLK
ncbi:MAG: transketolase, partial [Ginsengibacter sp.]